MRPAASTLVESTLVELDARDEDGATILARIVSFSAGILSGSIAAAGPMRPTRLFVTADGRFVGEAPVIWNDTIPGEGDWSFDARVLPPDLLLEDRVRLAVLLSGQVVLDSRDIDPTCFPPPAGPSRRPGTLEGYIDGAENGIVRGWVRDTADPGRRVALHLYIDGRFCGIHVADIRRADLEAIGRGDGRYGFSIPARAFLAQAASLEPSVRVLTGGPGVWEVPFAPHLRPRRRRLAIPRLGDIPGTTRELVALLASTEPFPKKTFVIDRLTRTMPDAFSADYMLLAIEYLRVEMLKTPPPASATWRERVVAWWRQRLIRAQIRRLSALADAAAASQSLLHIAARRP